MLNRGSGFCGRQAMFGLLHPSIFVCIATLGACSSDDVGAPQSSSSALLHSPVTGAPPTNVDWQSETALSVQTFPASKVVTAAFNDDTNNGAFVIYDPLNRTILPGASHMGWAVSDTSGQTFYYGGKVSAPTGWPVLWGDPAITSSRSNQNYVYLSSLAVPQGKFPPGNIQGTILTGSAPGLGGSYLGGACIARSTDAGHTFAPVTPSDCVQSTDGVPAGDFYDGGSMESDNSNGVYASFVDWTTTTIDVWHATTLTGAFARMPTPFPGIQVGSHPRLVFEPSFGRLYVMALGNPSHNVEMDVESTLWITYWGGPADPPGWSTPTALAADSLTNPTITFAPTSLTVRTAYQFSFATAQPSVNNDDGIRVAYTTKVPGHNRVIHTVRCPWPAPGTPVAGCHATPEWSGDPFPGDQWNPLVRAQYGFGTPGGSGSIQPEFMLSYTTTMASDRPGSVGWAFGPLGVTSGGVRVTFVPQIPYSNYAVCPSNQGYWCDYDDMQVLTVGIPSNSFHTFIRMHTDSSAGCTTQWNWASWSQHVSAITYP